MTPMIRKVTTNDTMANRERVHPGCCLRAERPRSRAVLLDGLMQLEKVLRSISSTGANGFNVKVVRCSLVSFKP